jgi:hypothetical protein
MQPAALLPQALYAYRKAGGTLHIGVFDDCDGSDAQLRQALAHAIAEASGGRHSVDLEQLARLPAQLISREAFLRRDMVMWWDRRTYPDPDQSPPPAEFGGFGFVLGVSCPAFASGSAAARRLYEAVIEAVAPSGAEGRGLVFCDWKGEGLPAVSPFFTSPVLQRMEWWNAWLLTAYAPGRRRLSVIVGSFEHDIWEVPDNPMR